MSIISDKLESLGLNKSEVRIYIFLLENGISTPPQVSAGTGILRANAYKILKLLQQKDLIKEQAKGKRKAYLPADPNSFAKRLEKRKEIVDSLIPDLRALYKSSSNKPSINFFEGWDQVEEIYNSILNSEELIAIGSTKQLTRRALSFFESWVKKLSKKKVIIRDMVTYDSKEVTAEMMKKHLGDLYTFKLIPKKYGDLPTDILIWGDNVAIISLEDPVFGTVLTSKNITDTYRVHFKMMWQQAIEP